MSDLSHKKTIRKEVVIAVSVPANTASNQQIMVQKRLDVDFKRIVKMQVVTNQLSGTSTETLKGKVDFAPNTGRYMFQDMPLNAIIKSDGEPYKDINSENQSDVQILFVPNVSVVNSHEISFIITIEKEL